MYQVTIIYETDVKSLIRYVFLRSTIKEVTEEITEFAANLNVHNIIIDRMEFGLPDYVEQ